LITADRLTKRYGPTLAVDDLSFNIMPGKVTGFLGPNGAGKSTTLRMILALDAPDSGTVTLDGHRHETLRRPLYYVGAMLEGNAVHDGDRPRLQRCRDGRGWNLAGQRRDLRAGGDGSSTRGAACRDDAGVAELVGICRRRRSRRTFSASGRATMNSCSCLQHRSSEAASTTEVGRTRGSAS
jgi:energy-coupling factor transporter ATP-binding protein EcfA2